MSILRNIFIVLLVLMCCLTTYADKSTSSIIKDNKISSSIDNTINTHDMVACFNNLVKLDFQHQMLELDHMMKDRLSFQDILIESLSSNNSKGMRYEAAFMLGYYHMDQAVRYLSDNISLVDDTSDQRNFNFRPCLWVHYPAAQALVRLGTISVPGMIDNIHNKDDAFVRKLSTLVIKGVYGIDIGVFVLQKDLKTMQDELKTAQDELKSPKKYLDIKHNELKIAKDKLSIQRIKEAIEIMKQPAEHNELSYQP